MATKKFSALTTGTTANATDKIPVERSGANLYVTPAMIAAYLVSAGKLGMIARYHNSALISVTAAATPVINFNTLDYDPLTTVTTGAAWHFTTPATGWYQITLENLIVQANGSAWIADESILIDPLVNGSSATGGPVIAFEHVGDAIATTNHDLFLPGVITLQLTAADTLALEFCNFSAATRKIGTYGAITITRVA